MDICYCTIYDSYSNDLHYSIQSIIDNIDNTLVVLGNENKNNFDEHNFIYDSLSNYNESVKEISEKINNAFFGCDVIKSEHFNILKWIYLRNYMREKKINFCVYVDIQTILTNKLSNLLKFIDFNENTYYNLSTNSMIVESSLTIISLKILNKFIEFVDIVFSNGKEYCLNWAHYCAQEIKDKHGIFIENNYINTELLFGDFLANHQQTWFMPYTKYENNGIINHDIYTLAIINKLYVDVNVLNVINNYIYFNDNKLIIESNNNQQIINFADHNELLLIQLNLKNHSDYIKIFYDYVSNYSFKNQRIQISKYICDFYDAENNKIISNNSDKTINIVNNIDLFLKTYSGDFHKLDLLLCTINKYVIGYRQIIIITDDNDNSNYLDLLSKYKLNVKLIKTSIPKINVHINRGIGYIWQQIVKLNWFMYTDSDCVFILDSDNIFCKFTDIKTYLENGKKNWFFRNWNMCGDAICWKNTTDKINKQTNTYETMAKSEFMFFRNDTERFVNYCCDNFNGKNLIELFINRENEFFNLSEFNAYGNWCMVNSNNYKFINIYSDDYNIDIRWSQDNDKSSLIQLQCFDYDDYYFQIIQDKILNGKYSMHEYIKDKKLFESNNFKNTELFNINNLPKIATISFPRSGLGLFDEIFRQVIGSDILAKLGNRYICGGEGSNCECKKNGLHLFPCNLCFITKNHWFTDNTHDLDIDKTKIFVLYRENISKSFDAHNRFGQIEIDWFTYYVKFYSKWVIPYITKPHKNVLLVEYMDFINNPQILIPKILNHAFDGKINIDYYLMSKLLKIVNLKNNTEQYICDIKLAQFVSDLDNKINLTYELIAEKDKLIAEKDKLIAEKICFNFIH